MNEPREFWIYRDWDDEFRVYNQPSSLEWDYCFHVIEKSAYDALAKENERLSESNITLNKMMSASGVDALKKRVKELEEKLDVAMLESGR